MTTIRSRQFLAVVAALLLAMSVSGYQAQSVGGISLGGGTGGNGPTGPTGPVGATGPGGGATGATGPAGGAGATGATGPAGAAGSNGTNGAAGATGPSGPSGPSGATGAAGGGASTPFTQGYNVGATSSFSGMVDPNLTNNEGGLLPACANGQALVRNTATLTWDCTTIALINTGTATIDFGALTGPDSADSTTITVAGATVGDVCWPSADATMMGASTKSSFMAYVSGANAAKIRHTCATGTCDPNSASFRVDCRAH